LPSRSKKFAEACWAAAGTIEPASNAVAMRRCFMASSLSGCSHFNRLQLRCKCVPGIYPDRNRPPSIGGLALKRSTVPIEQLSCGITTKVGSSPSDREMTKLLCSCLSCVLSKDVLTQHTRSRGEIVCKWLAFNPFPTGDLAKQWAAVADHSRPRCVTTDLDSNA